MVGLFNAVYAMRGMQCCGERGLVWRIQASFPITDEPGQLASLGYRLRSFNFRYGVTDALGQSLARIGYAGLVDPALPDSLDDAYLRTGGWVMRNLAGRAMTAVFDGCVLGCGTPYIGKVAGTFLRYDKNGNLLTDEVLLQVYSTNGDDLPTHVGFLYLRNGGGHSWASPRASHENEYNRLFRNHGVINRRLSSAQSQNKLATKSSLTGLTPSTDQRGQNEMSRIVSPIDEANGDSDDESKSSE